LQAIYDESIFLYAFDRIELNGDDLRRDPLEGRKATLEMMLAKAVPGIRFKEHMKGDGPSGGVLVQARDYFPARISHYRDLA
jgi:ATP-dependent DNA ligase